jgi:hypothetical protein
MYLTTIQDSPLHPNPNIVFPGAVLEEEDLPFSSRYQPLPTATHPNSTVLNRNPQTIQAPKAKSNPKQAYPKIHLRVFFFFCTVFRNYSLNQPAIYQMLLQSPYLRIFYFMASTPSNLRWGLCVKCR